MSVETLPEYLSPPPDERGDSLGLDPESYRRLAKTALAVIRDQSVTMGLYRVNGGCALDIFGEDKCVTIVIESSQNRLSLFTCGMDAAFDQAVCLISAVNEEKTWRKLQRLAKQEIKA